MSDVRFYPVNKDSSYYEHLHRYLFARTFVHNKMILDISSGEGYGSDILHKVCRHVIGCDIDEDAVRDANKKYGCDNLRFVQGDCREMPFEDKSFDAVISFETIEHINEHEAFLKEVDRVLKKRGLFIVSTPDKKLYTDERDYHNTDHVHELYKEEFIALLKQHFKHVHVYGERLTRSCFMGRLDDSKDHIGAPSNSRSVVRCRDSYVPVSEDTRIAPMYIILVCSNYRIPRQGIDYSYFFDSEADDEIILARKGITDLEGQVKKAHGAIGDLEEQLQKAHGAMSDLEEQLQKAHDAIGSLNNQISIAQQTIQNKDLEIFHAKEGIEDLKKQLENAKTAIDTLQQRNEGLTAELAAKNEEDNHESDIQYRESPE